MSRKLDRLKPKKVKGRISVLKALPYKGNMVYVRFVTPDIFMYDLIFKDQIYSSYMIITPRKGQVKLTKDDISQCGALLWAGAEATIDQLSGDTLDKNKSDLVKEFENVRGRVDNLN